MFNVVSGHLTKKARLEVLMDDGYWPAFSTIKARSTNAQWQHVGEGFIKELDFGRVWLRLNENDEGDKDNIIAEWKGDAKAFLESTLVRILQLCLEILTLKPVTLFDRMAQRGLAWRMRKAGPRLPWRSRLDMSLFPSNWSLARA